jgi:hypothetical protein
MAVDNGQKLVELAIIITMWDCSMSHARLHRRVGIADPPPVTHLTTATTTTTTTNAIPTGSTTVLPPVGQNCSQATICNQFAVITNTINNLNQQAVMLSNVIRLPGEL